MNQMLNFFGNSNRNNPFGNTFRLIQMLVQFAGNPYDELTSIGANIPQQLRNNPEGMVNYLRNSGQMDNQQYNQFYNNSMSFMNKYGNQILNLFRGRF